LADNQQADSDWLQLATELIKHFEGFSPTPYQCSARVWTIGYGQTRLPHASDPSRHGERVTAQTPPITEQEAEALLAWEIEKCARQSANLISVELSPQQKAACISFIFNLGSGAFLSSTLRRKLNREDYFGAADEFRRWVFAGGRKLRGLVRRREAERELFLSGTV